MTGVLTFVDIIGLCFFDIAICRMCKQHFAKASKNSKETKAVPEVRVEACVETALEVSMKVSLD